jgi:hypothetical protein
MGKFEPDSLNSVVQPAKSLVTPITPEPENRDDSNQIRLKTRDVKLSVLGLTSSNSLSALFGLFPFRKFILSIVLIFFMRVEDPLSKPNRNRRLSIGVVSSHPIRSSFPPQSHCLSPIHWRPFFPNHPSPESNPDSCFSALHPGLKPPTDVCCAFGWCSANQCRPRMV